MDKLLGRKLAKKLRRGIKSGVNLEELIKKESTLLKEREINPSRVENLLADYEAHYKIWRDFIEKEAEEEKSYRILTNIWKKKEINQNGLKELVNMDLAIEKLGTVIFGNYQEKHAAKKLLKDIEANRVLSSEIDTEIRKTSDYLTHKKKYENGKLSSLEILKAKEEQLKHLETPPKERFVQVLYDDIVEGKVKTLKAD